MLLCFQCSLPFAPDYRLPPLRHHVRIQHPTARNINSQYPYTSPPSQPVQTISTHPHRSSCKPLHLSHRLPETHNLARDAHGIQHKKSVIPQPRQRSSQHRRISHYSPLCWNTFIILPTTTTSTTLRQRRDKETIPHHLRDRPRQHHRCVKRIPPPRRFGKWMYNSMDQQQPAGDLHDGGEKGGADDSYRKKMSLIGEAID